MAIQGAPRNPNLALFSGDDRNSTKDDERNRANDSIQALWNRANDSRQALYTKHYTARSLAHSQHLVSFAGIWRRLPPCQHRARFGGSVPALPRASELGTTVLPVAPPTRCPLIIYKSVQYTHLIVFTFRNGKSLLPSTRIKCPNCVMRNQH